MTSRKSENKKERMKLISVHLPEWMIAKLEEFVKKGIYPSRSEAIRVALHQLIMKIEESEIAKKERKNVLVLGR